MIEIQCDQLSPEWWEARRGIPTSSDFNKIMTPTKRLASASQEAFIAQLLADISCQNPAYFTQQGGPVNQAVAYGRATEAKARRYYEAHTGTATRLVGFCLTDDRRFGASPDALVDPDGGLELKCPERKTHLLYLMKGVVPTEYLCQVHGHLIVTGRRWVDFMSYCEQETPLLIRTEPNDFTMALRVQLELFSKKFEAAKLKFGHRKEDEQIETPESRAEVAKWNDRLAQAEGDVHDGTIDEQAAVERVNSWLPELKAYEHVTKRAVYKALKAWIDVRPQPWYLDNVNLIYRLEKDVEF